MPSLTCTFDVRVSHNRNEVGFSSLRIPELDGVIDAAEIRVVGWSFLSFSLKASGNRLVLDAVAPDLDLDSALNFIAAFASALTAEWGIAERNAPYGNFFVEADLTTVRVIPSPSEREPNRLIASDSMSLRITDRLVVDEGRITSLRHDPLRDQLAEGLRASTLAAKFFNWFIVVEEFVERNPKLTRGFAPLFDTEQSKKVTDFAGQFDERRRGNIVGVLRATELNREHKLLDTLQRLGIFSVQAAGAEPIPIDVAVCKKLTKQRNSLFHSGGKIDEHLVFKVLLPLVVELAKRSDELLEGV